MAEEKKDEEAGDPFKIFIDESLERQRNTMLDNVSQILWRLPTENASSSKNHSGGAIPYKVQVNFEIPIG